MLRRALYLVSVFSDCKASCDYSCLPQLFWLPSSFGAAMPRRGGGLGGKGLESANNNDTTITEGRNIYIYIYIYLCI